MNTVRMTRWVSLCVLLLGSRFPSAGMLLAQSAPAATPTELARHDLNRNGLLDPSELAALTAERSRAVPVANGPSATPTMTDDVVSLSPFEVVSDTKGYYSANTMSGTRFNSKLEDLASSITVMTKEQMQDFGMLDINDIFLYTASAEGTGTYTDFEVNRNGDVQENVSLNPTQANRVRGIAAANVSLGNFETMGRTPVDPLGLDAVEVSRGPNASVFGLGNPSGTVNMVASSANLTRNRAQSQLRVDNLGGYRVSLDVNRVLIPGKLSARVSGAFQHDAFVRKPSGTNTVRYNGMVKYQPFKNTTISGSYSFYRMNGNRPNFSPPRDSVSYWEGLGSPTWDPVDQVVHVNGQTFGPFTNDTALAAYGFNRSFTGSGRFYGYIGDTGLQLINPSAATTSTNPGSGTGAGTRRLQSVSAGAGIAAGRFTAQPLFTTTPSVQDKDMYDWTKYNLAAVNRVMDSTITGSIQIDQIFFNTPRHTLAFQGGWLREDSERYARNIIGELNANGQSGQLLIDINERRVNGTANPFFLRPYIGVDQPFTTWQPQLWDTYRGQLGYKLDLTRESSWLRWLGMHQFSGYDEYKYRLSRRYAFKDGIASDHAWIPAGVSRVNQGGISGGPGAAANITRGYFRYYLGDNEGHDVDRAPNDFYYTNVPFLYGNPTTGFVTEQVNIRQIATTDRTGGNSNTKTILKTIGGVVQSHFFDSRIVTTFGLREDKQYVKNGSTPQRLTADGLHFDYESIDHWSVGDYRFNSGKTKQQGVVVRPFRGMSFVRDMNSGGTGTRFLGQFLNGLSLHYNKSDSFRPQDPRVNLYLQPLPNPAGEGEDWGFALNMFDNKFVLRVNKYENVQLNSPGGDAGTIAQRVLRTDMTSAAAFLLQNRAIDWVTEGNPTWTEAQVLEEVGRQMGIPWEKQLEIEQNSGRISSTNDITAKGMEIELNYNPTNFWTVAASLTETQSFNSNVSREIQTWIDERMPIWTTIQDPRGADHVFGTGDDGNVPWWTTNYGGSQTAAQNFAVFVSSPYSVIQQAEGTARPQIRRYAARMSTNFRLSGITDHRLWRNFNIGGAVRWQDKGAIGYYGKQQLPATITELDRFNPIYDKAQYFVDAFIGYRTRLFDDKVGATFQLNVRNAGESGHLQPIGAYPDGTPHTYRIVDPRTFFLTATFDL